jgi:hypothetical protein
MNWKTIAINLVLKGQLKTAITVMGLNNIDTGDYSSSFEELTKLTSYDKLEKEDDLAASMLAHLRSL